MPHIREAIRSAHPVLELRHSDKSSLALYESLHFAKDFIVPTVEQRPTVSDENEVEHVYIEVNVDEDNPCFMYDDSREVCHLWKALGKYSR